MKTTSLTMYGFWEQKDYQVHLNFTETREMWTLAGKPRYECKDSHDEGWKDIKWSLDTTAAKQDGGLGSDFDRLAGRANNKE